VFFEATTSSVYRISRTHIIIKYFQKLDYQIFTKKISP